MQEFREGRRDEGAEHAVYERERQKKHSVDIPLPFCSSTAALRCGPTPEPTELKKTLPPRSVLGQALRQLRAP